MREIKFRGKRVDNGEWVYGYYIVQPMSLGGTAPFIFDGQYEYEVDPKTVGQYTGLKDRNGKEIYESDLLLIHGDKCLIEYDLKSASFIARSTNQDSYWALDEDTFKLGVRVVGNIYENPKLLN